MSHVNVYRNVTWNIIMDLTPDCPRPARARVRRPAGPPLHVGPPPAGPVPARLGRAYAARRPPSTSALRPARAGGAGPVPARLGPPPCG